MKPIVHSLIVAVAVLVARPAAAQQTLDIEAAQAILAVQNLDGWLLTDTAGNNPVARELVGAEGSPTRQWFYFVPAQGTPTAVVHKSEIGAFERVRGSKIEYSGFRDLRSSLRTLLGGSKRVAMEYAPSSRIASLTRVDDATIDIVRKLGVTVESSAELVQFTKSLWQPEGRVSHYVAMHHLARLKDRALQHIGKELAAGRQVSERDVQRLIEKGYAMRGISGPAPVVASGNNTGDPRYRPSDEQSSPIEVGDLIVLDLSAQVDGAERPIFARLTWVAYAGESVPDRYSQVFGELVKARDAAVALIEARIGRRRIVKGYQADQAARSLLGRAGLADKFVHRTGHSLDTSLFGDGANLDDYETHDTRNLVMGSGFTVGPGVYVRGDFGMRSMVCVYIGRGGIEVTGPAQQSITPVLAP